MTLFSQNQELLDVQFRQLMAVSLCQAKTDELAQHKTCIQSKTICVGMWNQISYDL